MSLIIQPGMPTITALAAALSLSTSSFDAAVAYVTFSGIRELRDHSSLPSLANTKKRFLAGIDWFPSQPVALDALALLPRCDVRIFDGRYLVSTANCQPRRTFHPKAYLVVDTASTLIVGSANLSANGLRRSTELSLETADASEIAAFNAWFNVEWGKATPWSEIRTIYSRQYLSARKKEYTVTEEDDVPDPATLRIRWVNPERLRLMGTAASLWIDVGHLHNRRPLPGTDLQFSQMTRVFFGHPPVVVPGNTPLCDVPLSMARAQSQTRPLVYNKASSMDRLSLPVPGEAGWPARYDNETLLFTKSADGSFTVRMASGNARADWKKQSESYGFTIRMPRDQREWGVF